MISYIVFKAIIESAKKYSKNKYILCPPISLLSPPIFFLLFYYFFTFSHSLFFLSFPFFFPRQSASCTSSSLAFFFQFFSTARSVSFYPPASSSFSLPLACSRSLATPQRPHREPPPRCSLLCPTTPLCCSRRARAGMLRQAGAREPSLARWKEAVLALAVAASSFRPLGMHPGRSSRQRRARSRRKKSSRGQRPWGTTRGSRIFDLARDLAAGI